MKRLKYLLFIMFLIPGMLNVKAQEKKNLTLSDIYERPTFVYKRVRGMESMKDGDTYAAIEKGEFNVYSYKTGKKVNYVYNSQKQTNYSSSNKKYYSITKNSCSNTFFFKLYEFWHYIFVKIAAKLFRAYLSHYFHTFGNICIFRHK